MTLDRSRVYKVESICSFMVKTFVLQSNLRYLAAKFNVVTVVMTCITK